jgi:uncharacterized membrane protein YagU involved in acid resistance
MKTRTSALLAILLGGLIAGTIDIGAACLITHSKPETILHNIAGGLLGRGVFAEGMRSAVIGLVLQWVMSLIIAAVFVVAAGRLPALRRQWLGAGLAYGVVIFVVMNFVVVPLSAYHLVPSFTPLTLAENLAAMLLFGVIVAFFARRVGEG